MLGNQNFVYVNPNSPKRRDLSDSDCGIRAISLATGISYVNVARKLGVWNYQLKNLNPSFEGLMWPDICKVFYKTTIVDPYLGQFKDMTVLEFATKISKRKNMQDKYFIVGCQKQINGIWYGHATFVKNGRYYDTWDCGDWKIMYVLDVTEERKEHSYDFRNMVQIRRGSKKRFSNAD